jgi:hypothetical protein
MKHLDPIVYYGCLFVLMYLALAMPDANNNAQSPDPVVFWCCIWQNIPSLPNR